MKKKITAILTATLILCSLASVQAQHSIGLGAGNHNTSYSAFQNPANTFPDKNRVYLNVWGAGIGFTNNFLTYNAPFGLIRMANGNYPDAYTTGSGHLAFDQNWLQFKGADMNKLYYLDEVYGPSIFFRTSRRTAIGLGVNGISGMSFDGMGPQVAKLIRYGLDTNGLAFQGDDAVQRGVQYKNGAFSMNVDRYQEWYFSLATVTRDRGPHFVKWGGTAKLLVGMGSAGFRTDELDYSIGTDNKLNFSTANASFYHTDDQSASTALEHPLGLKFDFAQGLGAGMDLGFIYEYRPDSKRKTVKDWWNCDDENRNGYAWKFGAAFNNLGFISYDGAKHSISGNTAKSWNINTGIIDNRSFVQGIGDRFATVDQGFYRDSAINAEVTDRYVVTTPATFNAQMDVNLSQHFYMGLNWQQSLKGVNSNGLKKSSYLSLVPRWESESAEVGLPITLTRDYTALNVGLYGRLGPVIVGTDNLAGLASFVSNDNYKASNVYFGLRFQIPACGWRSYEYHEYDTTHTDTVIQNDTLDFWKRDTIIKEKIIRDTIRIEKRDTVYQYKKMEADGPELVLKEAELKQREADLKKKEADLKAREAALTGKEAGVTGDCSKRIQELEDQLKRERDLYAKLNTQYQDCKDEKEKLKINIANLEKELATVKAENAGLKTDLSSSQAEVLKLRQEIARLKATNKPADAQVKTLDSLLSLEEAKNLNLQTENSKQKAEITGLKKTGEDQKKKITELETQIANLKANCTDKAVCDAQIRDLQDKLNAEKAKSADLEKKLAELRTEYEFEIAKSKKLEEQLKNCGSTEETAKLKAELEAQKKKCDELAAQVKTLQAEKAALEGENSTLKAKVAAMTLELNDTKTKLDAANAKIAELSDALKNCGSGSNESELKAQIESLKLQNSEKDAVITGLKNDKAKLETDLSSAKTKIADLEKQLAECKSKDCSELEAQLADYKTKYENEVARYSVLKEEYDALVTERTQLKAKIADLEAKLKNCSGSSEEISKLEGEISKLKLTITELNGQLDGKQKSLDDLQTEYDKVSADKVALQKQVTALQAQVKSLQTQVAELQEQLKLCQEKGSAPGGGE